MFYAGKEKPMSLETLEVALYGAIALVKLAMICQT